MIHHQCSNPSEVKLNKKIVQESYAFWAEFIQEKSYLNWGLWNKKLQQEFVDLNYNHNEISTVQDPFSLLLLYYLIRPLLIKKCYNKRLLDIGSGYGVGLKTMSQLLQTNYALGIDLTHILAARAQHSFYVTNEINYIQSDAEQLPLESNSFDIITNLESSHNYPQIVHFLSEVERVLAPGGYFCYADVDLPGKSQISILKSFIKRSPHLKIILKQDISKMVQAAIYNRLIINEEHFYANALHYFDQSSPLLYSEIEHLTTIAGLTFLPWWKIHFKTKELKGIAKKARKIRFWSKRKRYFYYLIQKN